MESSPHPPTSFWDKYLGKKWDLLPGKDQASDYVVRQMKFSIVNIYTCELIRIHTQGVFGYFKNLPEYRQTISDNAAAFTLHAAFEENEHDELSKPTVDDDIEELLEC